ncbi:ABC transporter permease [Nesterenkonia muleiensis]|uniref:ABC transporter permease n=1 Tax=Nesterenkonia muleiensis TaxID=2282648 RepID=UPI001300186A|nr:iron ABC transporter permease [Nesterenkonia muleiensis]
MRQTILRRLTRPVTVLTGLVLAVLGILVAAPLVSLVSATIPADGDFAGSSWPDVVTSPMAVNLFWTPLQNSLLVALGTAVLSTVLGAFLAWVVVLSDAPGRKIIAVLATIPFALPSFAIALAWSSVFRNGRVGGSPGILAGMGVEVPDWLAWGALPVTLALVAHYFSLSFIIIAAALAGLGGDLLAAAELTGASKLRVAASIAIPAVSPALLSSFLLAFAEGVSNFASPALLGLPVRFQTLSTRLYGSISTGNVERGYVLAILLVIVAAAVLYVGNRVTAGRSFAVITGKATRPRTVRLGAAAWPVFTLASGLVAATTILPLAVLALTTFSRRSHRFDDGFTLHYWVGESDPGVSHGMAGVFRNDRLMDATGTTIAYGLAVAAGAVVLGMLAAYAVRRSGSTAVIGSISFLSYVPFLIPGIALGAAFIALFGSASSPLPNLYGTFWILVLAGIAASVPYAFQTSKSALGQVSGELEEAAVVVGAGTGRRITRILLPLSARGVTGGAMLVFVTTVRDLSLVVLLVTPATPLLAVETFRYAEEGFTQHANAITLIIAAVSVTATLLARRLQGADQPWNR